MVENILHNEDLEEEIQRAYYDKSLYDADNLDWQDFNNIARHFAEWQKEQDNVISRQAEAARIKTQQLWYEKGRFDMRKEMMKDVVEGRVQCGYGDGNKLSIKAMLPQDSDLKYADKVKVLILKTE